MFGFLKPASVKTQLLSYVNEINQTVQTLYNLCTQCTHPFQQSSPDLRSLGVQSDGNTGINSMLLLVHLVGDSNIVHRLSTVLM